MQAKSGCSNAEQMSELTKKCNIYAQRVLKWREAQNIYMEGIALPQVMFLSVFHLIALTIYSSLQLLMQISQNLRSFHCLRNFLERTVRWIHSTISATSVLISVLGTAASLISARNSGKLLKHTARRLCNPSFKTFTLAVDPLARLLTASSQRWLKFGPAK